MASKKAGNKVVQDAGKQAIGCFPKAQLIADLQALAHSSAVVETGKADGGNASLDLVRHAEAYGVEAHTIANGDTSTVLQDWRANVKLVALELAAAGSPFAETRETENGTVAKLTGTGNNVMSIAKGVVDFGIKVDECVDDSGSVSYRSVRTAVEAARKQRKAEENPEAAALADAKADARTAAQELLKTVLGTDDIELIQALTATFDDMRSAEQASIDRGNEIDAEVEEAQKIRAQAG